MLSTAKMSLQSDLKDAFEAAAYDAYMEQYQPNKVAEAKSDNDVKKGFEDLADKFSKKFASSVSKDMATAIYDFVKEIAISVNSVPPSVISPSGPCTGTIPMTSFSVM